MLLPHIMSYESGWISAFCIETRVHKRNTEDDSLQQIKVDMQEQQQILHGLQNQIFARPNCVNRQAGGVGQLETWMTVAVVLSNQWDPLSRCASPPSPTPPPVEASIHQTKLQYFDRLYTLCQPPCRSHYTLTLLFQLSNWQNPMLNICTLMLWYTMHSPHKIYF